MASEPRPRRRARRIALGAGVVAATLVGALGLRVALRTPAEVPPLTCEDCGTLHACETIDLPVHFALGWAHLNHRISRIGIVTDGAGCTSDHARVHMIGGDFSTGEVFSDEVEAELAVLRYTPAPGESAGWIRLPLSIDPSGQASTRHTLDLAAMGVRDAGRVRAVVAGFLFRTDVAQGEDYPDDYEARLGYTARGFGVDVALEPGPDGAADLRVDVRFEPGAAEDAWFRADMNRAMQVAHTEAWVDVALVTVTEPRVSLRHRVAHQLDRPWRWTRELEPLPPEEAFRLPEAWVRSVEHPVAFAAWNFALDLVETCDDDGDCASGESCTDIGACTQVTTRPGDYVRRFELGMSPVGGAAPERVRARVSTATRAVGFRPLAWSASMRIEELALRGELVWLRGEARGPAGTFSLPLAPLGAPTSR